MHPFLHAAHCTGLRCILLVFLFTVHPGVCLALELLFCKAPLSPTPFCSAPPLSLGGVGAELQDVNFWGCECVDTLPVCELGRVRGLGSDAPQAGSLLSHGFFLLFFLSISLQRTTCRGVFKMNPGASQV